MSRCVPWSDEETQKAQAMKRAGHTYADIAERFGRTLWSVRAHLVRMAITAEERQEREKDRTARRALERQLKGQKRGRIDDDMPTPELVNRLLDDRDRRWTIPPRDLTAMLLGDPLPGFSALDARA